MLFSNGGFYDKEKMVFLNTFSLHEYINLLEAVVNHTISDLSVITGIQGKVLLEDSIYMHDYNPVKEVLKKNGVYDEEKEMKSIALIEHEKKKQYSEEENKDTWRGEGDPKCY